MPDTPEFLVERLKSEGERTLSFFEDLLPEQWGRVIYLDGGQWTIRELLAHFVTVEEGFLALLRNVLSGGSGAPEGLDIDRYNEEHVASLAGEDARTLIAKFAQVRAQTIEAVAAMKPADLDAIGRHPFLGVVPLGDIIKMIYRHIQIHLRDARRILNS